MSRGTAVITGAAAGLGLATCKRLAEAGYNIILLDRNVEAGESACRAIAHLHPEQTFRFCEVDLSEIQAIVEFVKQADLPNIDILVNNAGLYPTYERRSNSRDCELGLSVSLYGHFALTACLLPRLLQAQAPRVVSISSIAHSNGRIDPADPKMQKNYEANAAYCTSKLASLVFARELQRQAILHGSHLQSIAAHPGIARTAIGRYSDNPATRLRHVLIGWATQFAMKVLGHDAEQGAMSFAYAASHEGLDGGELIGPSGAFQFKGGPAVVQPKASAVNRVDAAALWQMAEEQTGQRFNWPDTANTENKI